MNFRQAAAGGDNSPALASRAISSFPGKRQIPLGDLRLLHPSLTSGGSHFTDPVGQLLEKGIIML